MAMIGKTSGGKHFLAASAALLALAGAGIATPAWAQPKADGAVAVAPLRYTSRTLPNGLKVFAIPDANTATVSVHVWYNVGSKDDPAGRSGFAHLFEHMMFKASENLAPEQFDRLTEDVGGFNNASTADDYTNYFSVVPANHLERILFAESDRMRSLVVDETYFASERDVVKEEFRQRILASPYGRLFGLYLTQAFYDKHPYGRPGIGNIEELNAATIEDVRAFHAAFYRPDNAVLVVAGKFNPRDLDRWVEQYFAPIKRPARAIPRVTVEEPARTAAKTLTVYEPNVPLPAIAALYPAPATTDKDYPAMVVLDTILSGGESSRLYQSLVYEQQIAAQALSFRSDATGPSALTVGAILSGEKSVDEGQASLLAEVAKLRDAPVTAAELSEAKNQIVTGALIERETSFGKASDLARSVILFGDPTRADTLLRDIQAVTAEDIQRVAQTWLRDDRRVIIRYLPEEAQNGAKEDVIGVAPTIVAQPLSIPASEIPSFKLAAEEKRIRPPEPGPAVSPKIPAMRERTLANGLRVIVARDSDLPIVSAQMLIRSGSSADPAGRDGLADLTTDLLTKGTKTRTATDIAQQIEALGASLSAGAGPDFSSLGLVTRSDRADEAFTLMADVALNPVFAEEELDRQRQQSLDGLRVALRQPGTLASFAMRRTLYGAGPYGGVATPETLTAITPADAVAYHKAAWRPDAATLVIAGDVTPARGFALAAKYFGAWPKPTAGLATPPSITPAPTGAPRTIVVDLPNAGQASVSLGRRGITRTAPDYLPAAVANAVLGGGYSARLNQEIRIKRGLSYGASSGLSARLQAGPIVASAQTKNESAAEVLDLLSAEFAKLGASPVPPAELAARKAALTGGFGREVETTSGLAGEIADAAAFGLPLSSINQYVSDVQAVDVAAVQEAARRLYDPKTATVVIAGDAKVFFDALKARKPDAQRIPLDTLDLNQPGLVKQAAKP